MTRQEEFASLLNPILNGEWSPLKDWIEDRQPDHRRWIEEVRKEVGRERREWLYSIQKYGVCYSSPHIGNAEMDRLSLKVDEHQKRTERIEEFLSVLDAEFPR